MALGKFSLSSSLLTRYGDKTLEQNKARLAISGPIGPVKNSRGADFTRSDTFIIVDAIKDYGPETAGCNKESVSSSEDFEQLPAALNPKRISRLPTSVSCSNLTPLTATLPKGESRKNHLISLLPRPLLPSSASTNVLSAKKKPKVNAEDEAVSTVEVKAVKSSLHKLNLASKLPKSRTMTVLHEIKNSVARSSSSPRSIKKTTVDFMEQENAPATFSVLAMDSITKPQYDGLSTPSSSSLEPSSPPTPPPLHYTQIFIGQSSAYWSGRFVSLHDKLCTERLAMILPPAKFPPLDDNFPLTDYSQPHQSREWMKPNSTRNPFARPNDDEDARCLYIFSQLDSLCVTPEAKGSLRRWQYDYARRQNRPRLLPEGCSMEDRGLVARFFGGKTRQVDRRSRDYLDAMYYGNASNAFGLTSAYGVDSRYLTFR